jgi:hypothetical protein
MYRLRIIDTQSKKTFNIYKLLFKSCRFAPQCRRKTKSQQSTRRLFYIIVLFTIYIGTSPNLSSIVCSSTSKTVLSLLVDLFFPNFVYICDIRSIFYTFSPLPLSLCLMTFSCVFLYRHSLMGYLSFLFFLRVFLLRVFLILLFLLVCLL